jgi:hypothetical protein
MHLRFFHLTVIGLAAILIASSCAPKATPPPVDTIGSLAAQLASDMLTQTVAAYSPTPPPPTITPTPSITDTPIPPPTSSEPPKRPVITEFTGCWRGPGPSYVLISNISAKKYVEIIGKGSVPGWWVIRNPYFHNPCWVEVEHVKIDPNLDVSVFPVMTPGP